MAGCFQELIHGYTTGLVEPCMMRGLQPRDRIALLWKLSFPLKQGSHLRSGKKQPHCAHLIGLPTTVFCDCSRPMGASIKRKRDSGINCPTAICLLSGQCISQICRAFSVGALCLSRGHHWRLICGPAGNRTTAGSLSAPSRTTPYQLSHEDTSPQTCRACLTPAACSLCSGTCLASQPAGTKLPRQESPQEGSSDRPGRSSKGDPSASAACH